MKLKQVPEDFQVFEQPAVQPKETGPFAFYRLEKQGWTTPDALRVVRQRWGVERTRVSFGGLKDRHARTEQYFTIYRGPHRQLRHQRLQVTYLGQLEEPYASHHIRSNRFQMVLRALRPDELARVPENLDAVQRDGVPNYFDDQRFGSVQGTGEFVARAMVRGQHEEALRLALAAPYEFDRAADRREKAILNAHWGDWPTCLEQLPPGSARDAVNQLCRRPGDFGGALARLRPELRGLYLSAYQSHLWNRILARWLRQNCRPDRLIDVPLKMGPLPFYQQLSEDQAVALARLTLPLPTARTRLDPADARTPLVEAVLAEDDLTMADLKLKGSREMFFSKGDRQARCLPVDLQHELQLDERHAGQRKLTLAFELPRGSYATLIVKRILE